MSNDVPSLEPSPDDERTICFCHNVSLARLKEALRSGALTFEDLQGETSCSTGCGGCEFDVRELVEKVQAERAARG
jgi:bacterioferritin-associated ferredoxin